MSRNRAATLVTLNTCKTFIKVNYFSSHFTSLQNLLLLHSIKNHSSLLLFNKFSTVSAERFDFYNDTQVQNHNISGQDRNFITTNGYSQNVHGFNGGISRDLRQNHPNGGYSTSPQGSSLEFQGNRNASYASNVVGQVNENSVGYNVRSNANYGGSFQENTTGSYTGSVQGFNNSTDGYQGSGGFNMNTNGLPRRVGDSSTPMSFGLNSRSVETAEKIQYVGTFEELDGFCKENKVKDAVEVLTVLENNGITVDLPRYLLLMQMCGEIGVLQYAKTVHDHLIRSLGHVNLSVHNKVLEMYSSCGSMSDAFDVFEKMNERNLTSWDTMITGLAKNGCGEDAIDLFTRFKGMGLTPDGQIFVGVFLACGVLFDTDEGMLHFESMSKVYGIVPTMEHYLSVVNMLGSIGCLEEAMEFIEKMPFDPNVEVWESLMNLCRIHGNIELGDHCAKLVNFLDPSRLTDLSKKGLLPAKESELEKEGEKKKRSDDLRDMRSKVQEYRAGDTCHPENYSLLKGMSAQMKEAGYVPELRQVLHDVDEESKEEALLSHSERLAVAHGLVNSAARMPIRVIKNLRVCVDCHNALKIMAKIVGRQFIIRDIKRFHHFQDGSCSCKDFW